MTYSNLQERGRPIKILDESLPLTTNVKSLDFTGYGVSGSAIGDEVTENIPGVSNSDSEAPLSGAIDGVNTVFTFTHPIGILTAGSGVLAKIIGSDGDYTVSGTSSPYTVTMVIAPQTETILRNYY